MIPNWLLIVLFASGAVAIAVAVWNILTRGKSAPASKPPAQQTPRPEDWYVYKPQPGGSKVMASAFATATSWSDRALFSGFEGRSRRGGDVPVVHYDEVPTAGSDDYMFGSITPVLAEMLPETEDRRQELKKELRTAGFYRPHAWQNLAAVRYAALMGSILLFGTLLVLAPARSELWLAVLLVCTAGLGWALPRLFVKNRAAERTSQIERAMPDLLDMLNMCVSQGLTVQDSLRRISGDLRPVYPDLGRELAIVCEQAEVGSLEHALENFAERIDVPEVRSFTSLLIQTERMGTSVSAALTEYSDNIRESLRQRADEKANRATFKLLFPTVLCLMPAVYMFLLGPAVIELSKFFNEGGQTALDQNQESIQRMNARP